MKKISIPLLAVLFIVGCVPVQVSISEPRPYLSLYELKEGKVIKVAINQTNHNQGKLVLQKIEDESFEGEYYLDGNYYVPRPYPGITRNPQDDLVHASEGQEQSKGENGQGNTFPEKFGFGNRSDVKPVGTAVLVGSKGTVIEIIFYHVTSNLQSGDGIAKDNHDRFYRIFLGQE
jgi:hypothetical protein